jgi:hypothetical protein
MRTDFNPDYWKNVPVEAARVLTDGANSVLETFPYVGWDVNEMKGKWRKRSIDDIDSLNHSFPCADAAARAVEYLHCMRINARLRLVTDPKVVQEFRKHNAPCLHIDAWPEVEHNGKWYGMDIGAGDAYFVFAAKDEKPREEFPEEEVFATTRPEEGDRLWYRKTVLLIPGKNIFGNTELSVLDFISHPELNLATVPYRLTKKEFQMVQLEPENEEHRVFISNKPYDINGAREFTKDWTQDFNDYWKNRIRKNPPKLVQIMYE